MVSILRDWFVMLVTTRMTNSFKMVLLRVLLDRMLLDKDAVFSGMPIPELAAKCREFLVAHELLRRDITDAATGRSAIRCSRMRRSPWAFSYSAALVITGEAMFEATRRFDSCPSCQASRPA